jgi:hypothetical protein
MNTTLKYVGMLLFLGLLQTAQATTLTLNISPNPLWTDTGIYLSIGSSVSATASGSWTPSTDYPWLLCGPDGVSLEGWTDGFMLGANTGALIAYVGSDPYQGHWGDSTFFPQAAGYWLIGSSGQFNSPYAGELWLGFNDDAQSMLVGDNAGSVIAEVTVVPEPSVLAVGVLTLVGALTLRRRNAR